LNELKKTIKLTTTLLLIAILSAIALASAVTYIYVFPPSYTSGTSNPKSVSITGTFSISPTTWNDGDQITLTDKLSQALPNITVVWYEGNDPNWVEIGRTKTNAQGIATFVFLPVGTGTHNYKAQPVQEVT
jgi:hypothetical protein